MILGFMGPWIIPTNNKSDSFGNSMPLSPLELNYQEIVLVSMVTSENHTFFSMNLDTYVSWPWLVSWDSMDPFEWDFPINETIIEVMYLDEIPWNVLHHHSYFLPSLDEMPSCLEVFVSRFPTLPVHTPILVHEVLSEGNIEKISLQCLLTFPLN